MALVSDSLRQSLDNLNSQVRAAEKLLRKIPGSRSESAEIPINFALDFSDCVLRFGCTGFRDRIVVCTPCELNTIDSYSIDIQIEIAKLIPDLFAIARSSESDIREAADDAADAIQHAIAGVSN
jgi:hypothetical protein